MIKRKTILALMLMCSVGVVGCGNRQDPVQPETETQAETGTEVRTEKEAGTEYVIEDASEQTTEFYLPKEETDKLEEQYREVLTQIKTAVADRNMEELAQYVAYPCYVGIPDVIAVRSEEEFEALDVDQVLTEELVDVIENTDIDSLELYDAGYVVSGESGKPNITIGTGEDGKVGITGFNY